MLLKKLTGNPLLAGTLSALLLIVPLAQIYLLFPLQLIAPLPVFLVALRLGIKAGALAAVVPLLFCLGILGQLSTPLIITYLVMIWFPLLAAWLVQGGWRPVQILGGGYLLALALLVLFLLGSMLTGNAMLEAVHSQMMVSKQAIMTTLAGAEGADAQLLVEMGNSLDEAFRLFALLFPALFLSSWYTIQVANLLLARYLIIRWQMPLMPEQDLSSLRVPFFLVWPLIGCAMLALMASGSLQQLGLNLVLFLAIPYFFQGYSVVYRGFQHFKVSVFIRVIFYMILMTWSAAILAVTLMGLLDTWMDFRKRLT
ncbi:MAG: DUF2232 domain-containing protein [Magnetococcales bacterium]|nr:DUF2232 domain-containing protein [Magnetococcales bacterium]